MSLQKKRNYNHLLHTVDVMIENAVEEVENEGKTISCAKGCSHCCYLLVEVSWEEAVILAEWLNEQHPKIKKELIENIHKNANTAREVFNSYKRTQKYMKPYYGELNLPDKIYDKYFYDNKIPCPFLYEDACAAYEARPTPCRLHMVTSPSQLCSRDEPDDVEGYEVPDPIEEVKEDVSPITTAFFKDGRWGQLGIMVEAALEALEIE